MINIGLAKSQFLKLIARAAAGETIIIGKSGKPLVKLVAFSARKQIHSRIGFMRSEIAVPDNFDRIDVTKLFASNACP
jgi:prevent-host-death family protein